MAIPQIDNRKQPTGPLMGNLIWPLPADTPFGNFQLKCLKIIGRIDHINLRIQEAYAQYSVIHAPIPFDRKDITKHQYTCNEIVYWLRVTADELITLCHYLEEANNLKRFPEVVTLDSIGSFISRGREPSRLAKKLDDAIPFLAKLNDVSNAQKHSFINSDDTRIGADEPTVNAIALRYNKLEKGYVLHGVYLRHLILDFSTFFGICRDFILEENRKLPMALRASEYERQELQNHE